jgi:hypothetical protein
MIKNDTEENDEVVVVVVVCGGDGDRPYLLKGRDLGLKFHGTEIHMII